MEVINKVIKPITNDIFHIKILISKDIKKTTENIKNVEYKIPDINELRLFKNAIKTVPYLLRFLKI